MVFVFEVVSVCVCLDLYVSVCGCLCPSVSLCGTISIRVSLGMYMCVFVCRVDWSWKTSTRSFGANQSGPHDISMPGAGMCACRRPKNLECSFFRPGDAVKSQTLDRQIFGPHRDIMVRTDLALKFKWKFLNKSVATDTKSFGETNTSSALWF